MSATTAGLETPYWAACCVRPVRWHALDDYRCSGCQRRLGRRELYLWESSARRANREAS